MQPNPNQSPDSPGMPPGRGGLGEAEYHRGWNACQEQVAQPLRAELERLRAVLEVVAQWKLPPVRDRDGLASAYGIEYGSNGERDYMRALTRRALGQEVQGG